MVGQESPVISRRQSIGRSLYAPCPILLVEPARSSHGSADNGTRMTCGLPDLRIGSPPRKNRMTKAGSDRLKTFPIAADSQKLVKPGFFLWYHYGIAAAGESPG